MTSSFEENVPHIVYSPAADATFAWDGNPMRPVLFFTSTNTKDIPEHMFFLADGSAEGAFWFAFFSGSVELLKRYRTACDGWLAMYRLMTRDTSKKGEEDGS